MFVFPINRVPDETNHARMTWETFHKPTDTSFKWMDEIPSNDKVKLAEYKQIFAQKIDMSKEPFQFGVSLKTISFIPQLIGMTIGSWISPTVGMIIYMGRIFKCTGLYTRNLLFNTLFQVWENSLNVYFAATYYGSASFVTFL